MQSQYTGILLVLASAAGFATLPIFIKLAYAAGANTITILATRFILATACLWLILHCRGISATVNKRTLLRLCLLGMLGYGAMSTAFASSLQYLPASLASLLLYLYPAIVSILAIVLGQDQLNCRKAGALATCFSGLLFILGITFEGLSSAGLMWGIASAVSYSLYILAGNVLLKEVESLVVTTYVCTSAAVLFSVVAISTGEFIFTLPIQGWLALIGIAIFATIVGIVGFFAGMTRIGPATASIISSIEPAITVVLSVFLLGESITAFQARGGLLVLLGVIMLQRSGRAKGSDLASDPT